MRQSVVLEDLYVAVENPLDTFPRVAVKDRGADPHRLSEVVANRNPVVNLDPEQRLSTQQIPDRCRAPLPTGFAPVVAARGCNGF